MKTMTNNKGFTLIETIISLAILSIGILALFAMQTLGIRGNATASRVTTEAQWGGDEIEQMLTDKYAKVVNKDAVNVSGDGRYTVARTVTANTPVKNIKTIDVTVTSVLDGHQLIFQYLKANESAF